MLCSTMESGTKLYMSLYPEGSTDGGLRLGNIVPDFKMDTTQGKFDSFEGQVGHPLLSPCRLYARVHH